MQRVWRTCEARLAGVIATVVQQSQIEWGAFLLRLVGWICCGEGQRMGLGLFGVFKLAH